MIFDNGLIDPTGYFTISGNMKNSVPPKTYNGITYTTAMKIESSTTIKFIAEKNTKLVIVSDAGAGAKVKVNGITYISDNEGVFIIDISIGENVITKSTSMNVYTLVVG